MDTIERITPHDIQDAMKLIKEDKSSGPDGISEKCLICCNNKLHYLLSMSYNSMLIHSYPLEDLLLTVTIPLVKDKKGDITFNDNYRPIAIYNNWFIF